MSIDYKFAEELIVGLIESRPNRFIMNVEVENKLVKCHCPTTGRIGNIIFADIPCLLSKSTDPKRKTLYTVEAISVDEMDDPNKKWIGINQNAINKYIEFFLKSGQLNALVDNKAEVLREQTLGKSRLDFKVGNSYLEVKMPLMALPKKKGAKERKHSDFNSFDRFLKHINELVQSREKSDRALLLNCFQFNAPRFAVENDSKKSNKILKKVGETMNKGVEMWQINLQIDSTSVSLLDYFELTDDFRITEDEK
jgi:sugar fermentation stimulation protein A